MHLVTHARLHNNTGLIYSLYSLQMDTILYTQLCVPLKAINHTKHETLQKTRGLHVSVICFEGQMVKMLHILPKCSS